MKKSNSQTNTNTDILISFPTHQLSSLPSLSDSLSHSPESTLALQSLQKWPSSSATITAALDLVASFFENIVATDDKKQQHKKYCQGSPKIDTCGGVTVNSRLRESRRNQCADRGEKGEGLSSEEIAKIGEMEENHDVGITIESECGVPVRFTWPWSLSSGSSEICGVRDSAEVSNLGELVVELERKSKI